MRPGGSSFATEDRDEASRLLVARLEQLEEFRKRGGPAEVADPMLVDYAPRHFAIKAGRFKASSVRRNEVALRQILAFFGADVRLSQITVAGLSDYILHRRRQPGTRTGSTVSEQSIHHEIHALGNLFRRAVSEGVAKQNPVSLLNEKPRVQRKEAVYLEPGEAARFLEEARRLDAARAPRAVPYFHPILASFLYTGGRKMEVFGLQVSDVDFENRVIHIRQNVWRDLKHERHARRVPLWPDLHRVLEAYVTKWDRAEGLLFPSTHGGMLSDVRGSLSHALRNAGIDKAVTLHSLRHTYAAARLQTTDHGAPVSIFTVMRELGHRSIGLIESTYGHLLDVRHRSSVVEYRVAKVVRLRTEHHAESA